MLFCDRTVLNYLAAHSDEPIVLAFYDRFDELKFETTEATYAAFSIVAQKICQLSGGEIQCHVARDEHGKLEQLHYSHEGTA